ncbi:MAG: D-alanyl-D-alanine carboxypeptidase, partial [Muribaculum sp.]|nr:D-alanyl-D-alanine carboxypeptidase [Muribaculum sp.]
YDSSVLTISGSVAKTYASRYSLPSPAVELYSTLLSALTAGGISIGENVVEESCTPDKTKALLYKSPSRDNILKVMMHKSDNLFAEGMLHTLADKAPKAVKRERDLWSSRGIDMSGSRWLDGSGLSPVERISPRTLGQILSSMARSTGSAEYVALFPLAGRDGTVKSLLKDTRLEGRMALKSGSMNGVKCYAGYRLDLAGRPTHTVVIMVNGFSCKGSAVAKAIETYMLDILP